MSTTTQGRPRSARRGAALVEMAIVLPISIVLLVVSIDLCWLQVIRHTADTTAWEAAKSALVPGADENTVEAAATSQLERFRVRNAIVNVTSSGEAGADQTATVDITIPISTNTWSLANFRRAVVVRRELMRSR